MTHQQQYNDRLVQKLNEARACEVELEGLLAQKDDQLLNANARIQRLLAGTNGNNGQQGGSAALHHQLNQATNRAMQAESKLKETVPRFNAVYSEQKKHIQNLEEENAALRAKSGGGSGKLAKTKAELQRMRKAYEALQRQFEVEKREGEKEKGMPATAPGKFGRRGGISEGMVDDDQDDEEPGAAWLKQEPLETPTISPAAASSSSIPQQEQAPPNNPSAPITFKSSPVRELPAIPVDSHKHSTALAINIPQASQMLPTAPPTPSAFKSSPAQDLSAIPIDSEGFQMPPPTSPFAFAPQTPSAQPMESQSLGFGPSQISQRSGSNASSSNALSRNKSNINYIPIAPRPEGQRKNSASDPPSRRQSTANEIQVTAPPEPRRKSSASNAPSRRQSIASDAPFAQPLEVRQKSSTSSLKTSSRKRRRQSEHEELEDELQHLDIIDLSNTPPPEPTPKRRRTSIDDGTAPGPNEVCRDPTPDLEDTFIFKAVTEHLLDTGEIIALESREDLGDACEELWDAIRRLKDLWEEAKGAEWAYEFEVKMKNKCSKQCVSSKLKIEGRESGRCEWRSGCERLYACKQCVEEGRPCFVWHEDVFWLLPLHEEDRKWPVGEEREVRWWMNVE